MIRPLRTCAGLFAASVLAVGCSSNVPAPIPAAGDQVVTGADADVKQVKQWLDLIAKSGEGGSSLDGLKEAIDKLQIDAAKKDSLNKEYAVLAKANDPAKIKASAAKMSAML